MALQDWKETDIYIYIYVCVSYIIYNMLRDWSQSILLLYLIAKENPWGKDAFENATGLCFLFWLYCIHYFK